MKKGNFDRNFLYVLAAVLLPVVLWVASATMSGLLDLQLPWAPTVVLICSVILAVFFFADLLLAHIYKKRLNAQSVRAQQEKMLRQRQDAEKDLSVMQKRMAKLTALTVVYLILLLLLCVTSFVCLALQFNVAMLFVAYIPMIACIPFFCRLLRKKEKPTVNNQLNREEYPMIYGVLDRVSKKLNIPPPDCIATDSQFNASVFMLNRRKYVVNIGVALLSVLTEEELEMLLIHELAHMAYRDTQVTHRQLGFLDFIVEREEVEGKLARMWFSFPMLYMIYEYTIQSVTASSVKEARADAAVKQYGDPSVYAGILAKLEFNTLYGPEADRFTDAPVYASEEPEAHYNRKYVATFVRAAEERGDFWRKIIEQELPTLMESHPTFHERWYALGNCPYEVNFPDTVHPDAFTQECMKATDRVDQFLCENLSENYSEAREENYLKPLKIVQKWEETRELLPMDQMTPILNAYMALLRYDEAEQLCDRLLATDIPSVGLSYAKYIKGNEMLSRYDPDGIRLLDEAATVNHALAESALNAIILFCRRMGMREELEQYRSRIVDEGQKDVDLHQPLGSLNANDRLSVEHLPENRQEEITNFILQVANGSVSEIYLVRKTVTDDFFASVFVIRFQAETSPEQINDVMDQIFEHLDKAPYDWQYCLFLYQPGYEKIFRKLPEAKIYAGQ